VHISYKNEINLIIRMFVRKTPKITKIVILILYTKAP